MLYRFHVNVFASPSPCPQKMPVSLRGLSLYRLADEQGSPPTFAAPLPVTWEQVADRLATLPRMIFEPDGSFVWSGMDTERRWQVDGHLFEFHFSGQPRLHRLELHGICPVKVFDQLLTTVGWPEAPLQYELVQEGVVLAEEEFRRWASAT